MNEKIKLEEFDLLGIIELMDVDGIKKWVWRKFWYRLILDNKKIHCGAAKGPFFYNWGKYEIIIALLVKFVYVQNTEDKLIFECARPFKCEIGTNIILCKVLNETCRGRPCVDPEYLETNIQKKYHQWLKTT